MLTDEPSLWLPRALFPLDPDLSPASWLSVRENLFCRLSGILKRLFRRQKQRVSAASRHRESASPPGDSVRTHVSHSFTGVRLGGWVRTFFPSYRLEVNENKGKYRRTSANANCNLLNQIVAGTVLRDPLIHIDCDRTGKRTCKSEGEKVETRAIGRGFRNLAMTNLARLRPGRV